MITIPDLDDTLLEQLSRELGGCDFSGEHEVRFLSATGSCDVQAAPGNGKTTLLIAKLALLSRAWRLKGRGVCVISHTNAARDEIEQKLATHPSASAFLAYPHFVGTVTAFIDRFIALPYARGLGLPIHRIDDDVFTAVALSRWRTKPTLLRTSRANGGRNRRGVEEWVTALEIAADAAWGPGERPERVKIRRKVPRQPGGHTDSGRELEELKAEIIADGIYTFADMTALAEQALERCPRLISALRRRFPLVLLDEAQDTTGRQLDLLDRVFGEGVAYQRLGDQNQTLYEVEDIEAARYWEAQEGVIPLDLSRRFGTQIAAFASLLTVRAPQQIQGSRAIPDRRTLILFDRQTISRVLPHFASEVREHFGDRLSAMYDIRAVSSRHSPGGAQGNWPKSMQDYCPDYRSGRGSGSRQESLCATFRQASLLYNAHASPEQVVKLISAALVTMFRYEGFLGTDGRPVTGRNLWTTLIERNPGAPLKVKRLIRDRVLLGNAAWDAASWAALCGDLRQMIGAEGNPSRSAVEFSGFVEHGAEQADLLAERRSRTEAQHDGIAIKLGSIHSVKGRTVDALLVLETEVWRQRQRVMDLEYTLPHALGLQDRDFTRPVHLAAATNIFVAVTRPRQVLACAVRRAAVDDAMIAAARDQGWIVHDLTV